MTREVIAVLAVLTAGCGARVPGPATHEDFERLQVAEAALDRAGYVALSPGAPCEARCDATVRMERAADEACEVTRDLDDADARSRCDAAERSAADARRAVAEACSCPSGEGAR